jgi:hypothetical protein
MPVQELILSKGNVSKAYSYRQEIATEYETKNKANP